MTFYLVAAAPLALFPSRFGGPVLWIPEESSARQRDVLHRQTDGVVCLYLTITTVTGLKRVTKSFKRRDIVHYVCFDP